VTLCEWGVHVQRPVSAAEVELLEQAGIDLVTLPLPWRWMEPADGRVDMAAVKHLLKPLEGSSVRVQGLLGPAMPHALPEWIMERGGVDAPDFLDCFSRYCIRAVEELPGLAAVRIEDELNAAHPWETLRTRRRRGRRWRDSAFALELLLTASDAVRNVRPELQLGVTLQAGVPGWQRSFRRWLEQGLRVDRIGLSMSPCAWLPDPGHADRLGAAVAAARKLLAQERGEGAGELTQVEVSRTSYATYRRAWTPRRQREFLVNAAAAARDAGAVGFHWSSLRDQAYDDPSLGYWSPARERHEGLLYYDGSPKPVMDELRVLATGDRFGEGSVAL